MSSLSLLSRDDVLEVAVCPPSNAIIGKYQLFVETHLVGNDDKGLRRYELEDEDIIVLFNPWCSGTSLCLHSLHTLALDLEN